MPITSEPKGPKPPLAGLVKHDIAMTVNPGWTTQAHCILHTRFSDDVNHSQADITTLCNGVSAAWDAHMMSVLSGDCTHIHTLSSSLGGDGITAAAVSTQIGGHSSPPYPPQVAVCVSWQSGKTWRGGGPRTYLPAIYQGDTQNIGSPILSTTFANAVVTAGNALIAAVFAISGMTSSVNLGMPSYYSKGAFRPTPLFFAFGSALVHERLDSQRRRSGKEAAYPVV